jgi:hypothetical protein
MDRKGGIIYYPHQQEIKIKNEKKEKVNLKFDFIPQSLRQFSMPYQTETPKVPFLLIVVP